MYLREREGYVHYLSSEPSTWAAVVSPEWLYYQSSNIAGKFVLFSREFWDMFQPKRQSTLSQQEVHLFGQIIATYSLPFWSPQKVVLVRESAPKCP